MKIKRIIVTLIIILLMLGQNVCFASAQDEFNQIKNAINTTNSTYTTNYIKNITVNSFSREAKNSIEALAISYKRLNDLTPQETLLLRDIETYKSYIKIYMQRIANDFRDQADKLDEENPNRWFSTYNEDLNTIIKQLDNYDVIKSMEKQLILDDANIQWKKLKRDINKEINDKSGIDYINKMKNDTDFIGAYGDGMLNGLVSYYNQITSMTGIDSSEINDMKAKIKEELSNRMKVLRDKADDIDKRNNWSPTANELLDQWKDTWKPECKDIDELVGEAKNSGGTATNSGQTQIGPQISKTAWDKLLDEADEITKRNSDLDTIKKNKNLGKDISEEIVILKKIENTTPPIGEENNKTIMINRLRLHLSTLADILNTSGQADKIKEYGLTEYTTYTPSSNSETPGMTPGGTTGSGEGTSDEDTGDTGDSGVSGTPGGPATQIGGGDTSNTQSSKVDPDDYKPENPDIGQDTIKEKASSIIGIIRNIGIVISVITLIILGIKYMLGSVEAKAEYKKTMIPYVIGAIMTFAIPQLVQIIYNIVTTSINK